MMTISLPDSMKQELEARARQAGFASVDDYVLGCVLRGERAATEGPPAEDDDGELAVPPYLGAQTSERLVALAMEGLNSGPATALTRADWDALRRRVAERIAARRTG